MRIKYKLIGSYFALIIFTISVLGFFIAQKAHNEFLNEVNGENKRLTESIETTLNVRNTLLQEKSYGDLNFANTLLNNFNDLKVNYNKSMKVGKFNLPVLYLGEQKITLDDTIVNKIKQSSGTVASIFLLHNDKLIRISSTVSNTDPNVLGTYIPSSSDVYKKIIDNKEYVGDIAIDNVGYMTRMRPLLDKNKKVIGAIGVGNKILDDYLKKTLSNIKLWKTGYVYIVDSEGNPIIYPSRINNMPKRKSFVKDALLNQSGVITYMNSKEVKKSAYYKYFKPWNWYIVSTIDYSELNSPYKSILITLIVGGIAIVILAGIIAVLIANNLVNPINKLKACMEIAKKGDLTVHCDVNSKDEIGVLANSFNNMLAKNKLLVETILQYDKLKTEFIANMSHELRTPLNIIFSTVQLFDVIIGKEENLKNSTKIRNYTSSIKQNCYRLVRLVNNLIDITKIDSGFMDLNLSNQNIVEIAENITQSTAEYVHSMSRNIIFDTNEEEKVMAFDPEKLERILLNLISNAVKFTNPGDTISVTLNVLKDEVYISVKDTGIGIQEEKLSQLFQRFKQIDPLLSRSHEGSGIGLTIVKGLVELHGGTIEVKSNYGEGTEFLICLPAKIIDEKNDTEAKLDFKNQSNVENINIEFSDIYK